MSEKLTMTPTESPKFCYGMKGLATLLQVSKPTAIRIRKKRLAGCYAQSERTYIFNIERVFQKMGMTE